MFQKTLKKMKAAFCVAVLLNHPKLTGTLMVWQITDKTVAAETVEREQLVIKNLVAGCDVSCNCLVFQTDPLTAWIVVVPYVF